MSGPTTVAITYEPLSVALLAVGIRAANAIADAKAQAEVLRQQHQAEVAAIEQQYSEAELQQQQNVASATRVAQARFEQLLALADSLGLAQQAQACRPPQAGATASMQYAAALEALNAELEAVLRHELARRVDSSASAAASADLSLLNLDAALAQADALQAHPTASAAPGTTTPDEPGPQGSHHTAQRLLARIQALGPVPADIAQLGLTLAATPPGERADLLAMTLRQQIQDHITAVGQRMAQEAAAVIVQKALQDLGYQVEEIGATLFVEGGVVHFKRPGWGDYMVRMRVNAKTSEANFNVIRAVAEQNNEVSVLDHLAEDRWCSEFPTLMQTLAARGVHLQVTRRLEAGELPVQQVKAEKLPDFANAAQAEHEQAHEQMKQTARSRALP
jgi:hypothetical protein